MGSLETARNNTIHRRGPQRDHRLDAATVVSPKMHALHVLVAAIAASSAEPCGLMEMSQPSRPMDPSCT
eukprot:1868392-Prymnesium_polylepis.1